MTHASEIERKLARVRAWLAERSLEGALFTTPGSFAWLTGGGRNHVSVATDRGAAGLLVIGDQAYLLADNIEAQRLLDEELPPDHPYELREFSWWSGSMDTEAARIIAPERMASDAPGTGAQPLTAADFLQLRNPLLPEEIARYRRLGEEIGVVLTHVALHCRPGLQEHQLAGMLAKGLADFGIVPAVTLVAADERTATRRHPLPTDRRLERYAMLVVTGRRHGLHVSATRLVHFGPVPEDLQQRHHACTEVDAALIAHTRPGASFASLFEVARQTYAAAGYPDEWQQHHQGGPTGYAARDLKVVPGAEGVVQSGQAFAWNPTIAGTKSEDTILVTEDGWEVLSVTPDLPSVSVEVRTPSGERIIIERPNILER